MCEQVQVGADVGGACLLPDVCRMSYYRACEVPFCAGVTGDFVSVLKVSFSYYKSNTCLLKISKMKSDVKYKTKKVTNNLIFL